MITRLGYANASSLKIALTSGSQDELARFKQVENRAHASLSHSS